MTHFESFDAITRAATVHPSTIPDPSIGGSLIKMIVAITVLGACAWIIKRRATGRTVGPSIRRPGSGSARPRSGLRVIGRQALGKGAYLAIVEWEGREVLVGITNAGISFYEEPNPIDTLGGQHGADSDLSDRNRQDVPTSYAREALDLEALDLLTDRARPSILDPLRELTVRR